MNREEAIYRLKNMAWLYGSAEREQNIEAIDMAIEALSAEHKHCWDCKHYEPKYNVCHAPELVKQVTSKLKNPCDSLLTEESNGSKEQKSKLEHDREWIIGCIKHDGFIKTDRFDKANQIILDALSADATIGDYPNDVISRSALMEYCSNQKSKSIDNNDIARFPSADALLKQEIDFHKKVSRIEAEKVVDLENKLADMVSVVRCKDCKWYKKIVEKSKSGLCHYDLVARCLHDEDYCSHGERREE